MVCRETIKTLIELYKSQINEKERPKAVTENQLRPGERNPIEGKFSQIQNCLWNGPDKARLQDTSQRSPQSFWWSNWQGWHLYVYC